MDVGAFTEASPGKLEVAQGGYNTFEPAPLPPAWRPLPSTIAALADASLAVGELNGLLTSLPNPELITRPLLRREAVLSSRIEGTRASVSDVALYEADVNVATPDPDDTREVAANARALDAGIAALETLPISKRLICEVHRELMGAANPATLPGEFRDGPVWIGSQGCKPEDATYVPMGADKVEDALAALERYIHGDTEEHALIRAALVHYQFEAIHPFNDGNGRVGRALIVLMLLESQVLKLPVLSLSDYLVQNRSEYYRRLLEVSTQGLWDEWVAFLLRGITEQSRAEVLRSRRIIELYKQYKEALLGMRASTTTLVLLEHVFKRLALTANIAMQELQCTFPTANNALATLEKAGIVVNYGGRKRNRVYLARELVEIIQ